LCDPEKPNPVDYRVSASAGRTFRPPEGYIETLFGQVLTISEDDGTRTRNHRIDSSVIAAGSFPRKVLEF
jgi:hypothetical protein